MAKVKRPDDVVDVRWVIVPIGEVEVHDVWRVDGMAGTGSSDISMNDVFVPEHRTLDVAAAGQGEGAEASLYDNPLYAMPLTTFLALTAALPIVGAAQCPAALLERRRGSAASQAGRTGHGASGPGDVTGRRRGRDDRARRRQRVVWPSPAGPATSPPGCDHASLTHATTTCRDAVRRMLDTAGSSAHDSARSTRGAISPWPAPTWSTTRSPPPSCTVAHCSDCRPRRPSSEGRWALRRRHGVRIQVRCG
jgi:hypothetical protein